MLYNPDTIAAADVPIARNKSIGGEKRLWVSKEPCIELGELFLAGDGSGVWTPDAIGAIPAGGSDLACKVVGELDATAASVVTLTGVDQYGNALTGTATFSPPSYVSNKGFDFAEGAALDLTPATAGKRFVSITTVAITNAKKWSKLKVFALPSDVSWKYINMVEGFSPKIGISPGHPIPDGLDGAAEVVRGRSIVSSVSISTMHSSVADGLLRYGGRYFSVRCELWEKGKKLTERHILGNCILTVDPDLPDGDGEVKQVAEGMFQDYFGFFAK